MSAQIDRRDFLQMSLALPAAGLATIRNALENPFDAPVLNLRPRIFVRADDAFEGLTFARIQSNLNTPEFEPARRKWRSRPFGRALLWRIDGRREDLDAAIAGLVDMDPSSGSWSDRGPALMQLATLLDWLHDELDGPTRARIIERIERIADEAVRHVKRGEAPFFYSRTPGALAGLAVAGLALHGDSPKANAYLDTFRRYGVNEYFRAYDWVDGVATGATYTFNYTYVDLPSICAAWWSATGRNPNDWIHREQGDWLNDIVRFYLWSMRPGFAFTHINDQFRADFDTNDSFCQGLDIASYVTRNGHGRAWSERWRARFGPDLYHSAYAHSLIFRDPSIQPEPLTQLPLAALFGRESCGYGFYRSAWPEPDTPDTATHVFFRCGDPMDVHGGVAAGEFQVFRYAPLADRSGRYGPYDSPSDQYHRNAISANVVLFTDPTNPLDRGDQHTRAGLKSDHATWQDWLDIRERHGHDVARILDWRMANGEARCRADLTRTNPAAKCVLWEREFVWLANTHLIVLDVVETAGPMIHRTWQLHLPAPPEISDRMLSVVHAPPDSTWANTSLQPQPAQGRLFCQTLLPTDYTMVVNSPGQAHSYDPGGRPLGASPGNSFHREHGKFVVQIDPGTSQTRTLFLHVLTAVDAAERNRPIVTHRRLDSGVLQVSVDNHSTRLQVPTWATD